MPAGRELPWLYAISRNIVRNARRSRRRQGDLREKVASLGREDALSPEIHFVQTDQHRAVLEALARLSPDDQEVLKLKTWEELSNGDIAEVLGVSVGAIDMRISRARQRLVRAYESSEESSRVATPTPRFVEEGGEQ